MGKKVVGVGNNSGFAAKQLVSIVERIERLNEEKAALGADISEVYAEAKGNGFDPKIIRMCIRLRNMDKADRQEQEAVLDLYMAALHGHHVELAKGQGDDAGEEIEEGAEQ